MLRRLVDEDVFDAELLRFDAELLLFDAEGRDFAAVLRERALLALLRAPLALFPGVIAEMSFSKSFITLRLVFVASRRSDLSVVSTSLYELRAPRPRSLPSDCSALFASSSDFSKRAMVRSTSRRVAAEDLLAFDVDLLAFDVLRRAVDVVRRVVRAGDFFAAGMELLLDRLSARSLRDTARHGE